jgi:uncharacterized membrane protein YcgQ (UPF0703/DUF1980 family)
MITKIYSISILLTFFSVDLNKCSDNPNKHRITVVGTAIVIKNDAVVRTDDSLLYYLDGIYYWDDEYLGKRVKVTGKLFIQKYHEKKNTNTEITAIGQQDYGTRKLIKKPKWSLVE